MSSKRQRDARKAFEAEFQKQEKQKQFEAEAPIRAQLRENALLQQEIADREQSIVRQTVFAKPSEYLAEHCTKYSKNLTAEQVQIEIGNAVNALKLHLDETRGIEITPAGIQKLGRVVSVNPAIDTTLEINLRTIWDHLESNECLNASDFKVVREVKPAVEQKKTERTAEIVQAELDAIHDVRNPADRRKVQELRAELHVMEVQSSGIWGQWCAFVRENYDSFGADEQKRCTNWLEKNGLFLNAANLNKYRVHRGWFTNDEKLAEQIVNDPRQASDYSFKVDVRNQQRSMQQTI